VPQMRAGRVRRDDAARGALEALTVKAASLPALLFCDCLPGRAPVEWQ
jgi:hypothetical protein